MQYNPAFFGTAYTGLIDGPKTEETLKAALERIDGYLLERVDALFKPVLDYLAEAQAPVPVSEMVLHFRKKVQGEPLGGVYEWLARKGILHKLSSPLHLTRKSTVMLEEAAYYYEKDDGTDWE